MRRFLSSIESGRWIGRTAALVVLAVPAADAVNLSWANSSGGSASIAANWSPAQIPTAADDLTFNLTNSYPVTFNSSTAGSLSQTFKRGTVTVTCSSPHTVGAGGLRVADTSTDVATMTLTTGTLNANATSFVGVTSGSSGTLNVNDDDAAFVIGTTGGSQDLFVGSNGTGAMNITGGGRVFVADQFIAGNNSTSVSNVTISGFVAQAPFPVSRLEVAGASQSRFGQGGDATVNILNGALADFEGDLAIALGSASQSTVTVQGPGLVFGATLDVAGNLLLGRNTSAASASGNGTLNVNGAGRLLVGGTLFVAGDPDGGTGQLHVDTGGLINTTSLDVGNGATLDLGGGAINVLGGTLAWSNTTASPRFNGGTGNPLITMRNNATSTLSPTAGGQALVVGGGAGANLCDFDVRTGADLTTTGSVTLGEGSDDYGGMIIHGVGSTMTMPTNATLTVGSAGDARFEAELGATVTGGRLAIASAGTSAAEVLIENSGTTAAFRDVFVGGNSGAAGGVGLLSVNAQAVLNVNSPGTILVYAPGKINVAQSAVINAPAVNSTVHGVVELDNGAVFDTELISFHNGAILRGPNGIPGAATLDGRVRMLNGSRLELVNGDLTVGSAAVNDGFDAQDGSVVAVGAHTLTVLDQNRALFDDVTIEGGHIIAPNGIEIVTQSQNGRLDGTGTITGQVFIESGGSVITATGANGITINGQFRNNSGNIDGTKYTFNNNPNLSASGWTGAGAINARVVFNSGTKVSALANMTMGLNVTDGVTFNLGSELHAGEEIVTLIDSNGVGLPSVTDMDTDGAVVCSQPLTVNSGRRISGRGTVSTPSLSVFGRISPGELVDVPDGEVGELTILGNLTLGGAANADIELGGVLPPDYDEIDVNGTAALNGALNISFVDGYVPEPCDIIPIIRYNARTGGFTSVNFPPAPADRKYLLLENIVVIRFMCTYAEDLDSDGFVGQSDLALLLSVYNTDSALGDITGDGATDQADLAALLARYGVGCPIP